MAFQALVRGGQASNLYAGARPSSTHPSQVTERGLSRDLPEIKHYGMWIRV